MLCREGGASVNPFLNLQRWRPLARRCSRAVAWLLLATNLAGLAGHLLRDRLAIVGLLLYVPLLLSGAAAVVGDLALRGRGLRGIRYGLSGAGVVAMGLAVATTWRWSSAAAPDMRRTMPLMLVQVERAVGRRGRGR